MTQSFDGLDLNADRSIVNYGNSKPPSVLNIPVSVLNSNSRPTPIVIKDGEGSVKFQGRYQTLDGGQDSYEAIKAKQSKIGVLINGTQTVNNVILRAVGLAQERGGVFSCQLNFEYLGE